MVSQVCKRFHAGRSTYSTAATASTGGHEELSLQFSELGFELTQVVAVEGTRNGES